MFQYGVDGNALLYGGGGWYMVVYTRFFVILVIHEYSVQNQREREIFSSFYWPYSYVFGSENRDEVCNRTVGDSSITEH